MIDLFAFEAELIAAAVKRADGPDAIDLDGCMLVEHKGEDFLILPRKDGGRDVFAVIAHLDGVRLVRDITLSIGADAARKAS